MKRILIFSIITFFLYAGMRAQSVDIDEVLRRIEANNKELQANAQLITSQKLENKSENNLPDPTLSYSHLWGAKIRTKPSASSLFHKASTSLRSTLRVDK